MKTIKKTTDKRTTIKIKNKKGGLKTESEVTM